MPQTFRDPRPGDGFWAWLEGASSDELQWGTGYKLFEDGALIRLPTAGKVPYITDEGELDYLRFPDVAATTRWRWFWFECVLAGPRELPVFELRARLAGGFDEAYSVQHNNTELFVVQSVEEFELDLETLLARRKSAEGVTTIYLRELGSLKDQRDVIEGRHPLAEPPRYLHTLKRRKNLPSTGTGAGDLARAMINYRMKSDKISDDEIELTHQYISNLRKFQEIGFAAELSFQDSAQMILNNWNRGDRGFFDFLAKQHGASPTGLRTPPATPSIPVRLAKPSANVDPPAALAGVLRTLGDIEGGIDGVEKLIAESPALEPTRAALEPFVAVIRRRTIPSDGRQVDKLDPDAKAKLNTELRGGRQILEFIYFHWARGPRGLEQWMKANAGSPEMWATLLALNSQELQWFLGNPGKENQDRVAVMYAALPGASWFRLTRGVKSEIAMLTLENELTEDVQILGCGSEDDVKAIATARFEKDFAHRLPPQLDPECAVQPVTSTKSPRLEGEANPEQSLVPALHNLLCSELGVHA